jgi:hypothetical protein
MAQLKREDPDLDYYLLGLCTLEFLSSPIINQDVRSVCVVQSGSGSRGGSILVLLLQMAFLELDVDVSSLRLVPW